MRSNLACIPVACLAACATTAPEIPAAGTPAVRVVADMGRVAASWPAAPQEPAELFDVVKVVDGDTIHILRGGEVVRLRLLSVDTEEKISGRPSTSSTKPETIFGQETAVWARDFFEELREGDSRPRVGLRFPNGVERNDVYGRLLSHVLLPDGTDFNLLLVREGKSPYFNKYGNSRICHTELVAAQVEARRKQLGIWNPATNEPKTPGAPKAKRPYDRLLPWWQARAEAIDAFREKNHAEPQRVVAADEPEALERARVWCAAEEGRTALVFGTIDRFFEEDDGSLTVLFRATDRRRAFRAVIPADARAALGVLDLRGRTEEFRQNYLFVEGVLEQGPRGTRTVAARPEQWRAAGPEPVLPPE
ncbi:MAG: thermonuclease family protein [Planctomycetota bacterium]|nr:thermonuclease family protein [Planctomycetota bacterium]